MKETIYYTSTLKWFNRVSGRYSSKQQALKTHLEYVIKSKDFQFADGDKNYILERSILADKRVNSRIAFSFVFALPNDLNEEEIRDWIKNIKKIISKHFNMDERDLFLAYHDSIGVSGIKNKHLHILGTNLTKNNKGVRIQINTLKELQKDLQNFVTQQGYTIKRGELKEEHIGVKLRYDEELRKDYLELLETKKAYQQTLIEEKKKKEEEWQREQKRRMLELIEQWSKEEKELKQEEERKRQEEEKRKLEEERKRQEEERKKREDEERKKKEEEERRKREEERKRQLEDTKKKIEENKKREEEIKEDLIFFYTDREIFKRYYEKHKDKIDKYNVKRFLLNLMNDDEFSDLSIDEKTNYIIETIDKIKQTINNKKYIILLDDRYILVTLYLESFLDKRRLVLIRTDTQQQTQNINNNKDNNDDEKEDNEKKNNFTPRI